MRADPRKVLWLCVLLLGMLLLFEGAGLLAFDAFAPAEGLPATDWRQALLDAVLGIALVAVVATIRRPDAPRLIWALLLFGAFYVALGILGLTLENPFGLPFGPLETAKHLVLGVLSFSLGTWTLKLNTTRPPLPQPPSSPPSQTHRPRPRRRPQRRRS